MVYIAVEVGNAMNDSCHVLVDGRWMIPNMSYDDLRKVRNETEGEVVFVGDERQEIDGVPKLPTRCKIFVFRLTERAYSECQKLWSERVGFARF